MNDDDILYMVARKYHEYIVIPVKYVGKSKDKNKVVVCYHSKYAAVEKLRLFTNILKANICRTILNKKYNDTIRSTEE